ncbi:ATP-binding protein [Streptomyces sp. NPDC021224]|uniref:SCO6881 family protein n=1 Tax=unclassified Streptomyces TaxID=2593676 RepID=UPI0037AAB782
MGTCDLPLMDKVCDAVGGVVSGTGKAVTDGIGAWLAKSAGDLAASAADLAAKAVDETTAIDLSAPWFRHNYELLLPIGLTVTVGTFCLQLLLAAWRRDERALARAAVGTMTGVLFSFCAVAFTSVAITVVDALSDGLFQVSGSSVSATIRRVVEVRQLGALFGLGWGVPALVALGMAVGSFVYWGVMLARKVGVLLLVALAVFAGAGGGWDAAKRWRRGWIEATTTLVASKLLMTVVFMIGVSAMGKSDTRDGLSALSDALAGLVILVLVLLCPYALYRFVRWAGDGGGNDDVHRAGTAGFAAAAGTARTTATLALQARAGAPAPQGSGQLPGVGPDSVVTGIDPSGGHLSKEGIDGTPARQIRFRYGEDPTAPGDRGLPLIRRPGLPPLITRPGTTTPDSASDRRTADAPAPDAPFLYSGAALPTSPAPDGDQPLPPPASAPPPSGPPEQPPA